MPSDGVDTRAAVARTQDKQHARKAAAASVDPKTLYPKTSVLLGWALVAAVRVGVLGALATLAAHPLVLGVHDLLGLSDKATFFGIGLSLHTVLVLGYVAFYFCLDRFKLLQKYKVAHSDDAPKNKDGLFSRALLMVASYHFVLRVLLCEGLWRLQPYEPLASWREAPSFLRLFGHFFAQYWISEIFNYAQHRMAHEFTMLRQWHAPHHEFVELESPLSAEYTGYAELIVFTCASYLSTASYLPMTVHFITIVWKTSENMEVHGNYNFTGSLFSRLGLGYARRHEIHDFHHANPSVRGCYGKPVWADALMGTCDDYLVHLHKQGRHLMDW
jgi:sterol desaturase/sphingolipid hydroxylase (fatty acid hydroxylase superfamily)